MDIKLLACLLFLVFGCGDIIHTSRKPKDRVIPNENTSAQIGRCANFSGRWTALCDPRPAGLLAQFNLMQQSCELFQLLPDLASFNVNAATPEQTVAWSGNNYELNLTNSTQHFHFRMINGQRTGVWSQPTIAGAQECPLHWWPN